MRKAWPVYLDWQKRSGLSEGIFSLIFVNIFHIVPNILNSAYWGAIYTLRHPFFERYKVTERPWPWHEDRAEWGKLLKRSIFLVTVNCLITVPIFTFLFLVVNNYEVYYDLTIEGLPDWKYFLINIVFSMMCEDVAFYLFHRLLHWKVIYPYVHKIHHEYTHAVCIATIYAHPIEEILANSIPSAVGGTILGRHMHMATTLVWISLRTTESYDGHSGYEFSWSPFRLIPFSGSAQYHDFHHSHNVGNYCSLFSIWDTLCGTNVAYHSHYSSQTSPSKKHSEDAYSISSPSTSSSEKAFKGKESVKTQDEDSDHDVIEAP